MAEQRANKLADKPDPNLLLALADPEFYKLMLGNIPGAARGVVSSLLSTPVEIGAMPFRAGQGLANMLVPGGAQEFPEPIAGYESFRKALGGSEVETPTEAISGFAGGFIDPGTALGPIAKAGAALLGAPAALMTANHLLGLPGVPNAAMRYQAGMVAGAPVPPSVVAPQRAAAAVPESALSVKAPGKAKAEEWAAWLEGAQRRGQVSKEERADLGIDDWLAEHKGKTLTKEELQQMASARLPKLEVVNPAGGRDEHLFQQGLDEGDHQFRRELVLDEDLWERARKAQPEGYPELPAFASFESGEDRAKFLLNEQPMDIENEVAAEWINNYATDYMSARASRATGTTRYDTYQLPGGADYHERLITVPMKPGQELPSEAVSHGEMTKRKKDVFESAHWDEPNVVAHWRANIRQMPTYDTTAIGDIEKRILEAVPSAKDASSLGNGAPGAAVAKGLITPIEAQQYSHARGFVNVPTEAGAAPAYHVEEIQSDWHQAGREHGYKGQLKEVPSDWKATLDPGGYKNNWTITNGRGEIVALRRADSAEEALQAAMHKINVELPPDAPFKKSWPLLTMKNAITEAVDRGMGRVSWTPGAEQAKRYSLNNVVTHVEWSPLEAAGTRPDRTFMNINTIRGPVPLEIKDGVIVKARNQTGENLGFVGKPLSEIIGKEAAAKIGKTAEGRLEGKGLEVGGEGMKGFYDKILVNQMNDFLKPYGSKVQFGEYMIEPTVTRQQLKVAGAGKQPVKVPYFEITPQLKAAVEKGLPLY